MNTFLSPIDTSDRENRLVPFLEEQAQRSLSRKEVLAFRQELIHSSQNEQNSPLGRFLLYRLVKRFDQFCSVDAHYRSLLSVSILRICLFIETNAWPHCLHRDHYYKKNLHRLARSFSILSDSTLVIFSKSKVPLLQNALGTYEKVRTSLCLPAHHDIPATAVAHAVNRKNDEYTLALCLRKIEIAQMLHGKKGIVQLKHHFCTTHNDAPRINTLWDLYEGTLELYQQRLLPLTFEQLVSFAGDILEGLHEMHSQQIVHGDLKLPNILFRTFQGRLEAALGDFGFSFVVGKQPPNHVLLSGYYGSIVFTAPELFGNAHFTGDYFKVEIFALGAIFYQLFFKENPPWYDFLQGCYKQNVCIGYQQQLVFNQLVLQSVDTPLSQHVREDSQDDFYALLLRMMQLKAELRPTTLECLQQLRSIPR